MERKNISLYKIREKREAQNLTQERLSELSGVSRSLINQLETAKTSLKTFSGILIFMKHIVTLTHILKINVQSQRSEMWSCVMTNANEKTPFL